MTFSGKGTVEGKGTSVTVDEEQTSIVSSSSSDGVYGTFDQETKGLQQGVQGRHMRMVGLAGSIGTGLFLNIGGAISAGGPVGALLGYSAICMAVCFTVLTVGEMAALVPLNGGIVRYSEFFVDPALAFAVGWSSVYGCLIIVPTQLAAAAILMRFWITVDDAIWIALFGGMALITTLLFVRVYAEIEYATALVKLTLVLFFDVMALTIICGGNSEHEYIGFKYWDHPGPFVQYLGVAGSFGKFLGCWAAARNAFYVLCGTEGFSVMAGETVNPRKTIPQVARRIFFRVIFFYITTLFLIGMVVPSDDPHLLRAGGGSISQSPFLIAARRAGLKAVPTLINAAALSTAWSTTNTAYLQASRYLHLLSWNGLAPRIFGRVNRFGVPYVGIILNAIVMCGIFLARSSSISVIFDWFQSMLAVSALTSWALICFTYLRFYYGCQKQGIDRARELPWAAPFQPYATWVTFGFLLLILAGGDPSVWFGEEFVFKDFYAAYFNIILIAGTYLSYKWWRKTRIVPLAEMPIRHFINMANADLEFRPAMT